MKKIFIPFIIASAAAFSSCQDETSYTPQIEQMRDSLFHNYPTTVASITIKVEDKTDLKVVLGGQTLYAKAAENKAKMAEEVGYMAARIFGKDSYLRTGSLIITKDERNVAVAPPDGIATPIDLEGIKKSVYAK